MNSADDRCACSEGVVTAVASGSSQTTEGEVLRGAAGSPPGSLRARLAWLGGAFVAWVVLYRLIGPFSVWLTYDVLGLAEGSRLGSAVEFFLYDAPKVLLLLVAVVFAVGVLRTFVTPSRTRALLAGRREIVGNAMAAGLGVFTPFCTCSAIPLFLGFVTAGVPLGVTFSFLVAAPMVNEVALVLLVGLFGWQVATVYIVTGLAVAITAGWIIGRLHLEGWVEPWVYEVSAGAGATDERLDWARRIDRGWESVKDIVGRVWPYILAGIAVGAAIHGFVPEDALASIMGAEAWWSVPVAVLLGVPMYSNAAGIVPIVGALLEKGAALGTSLAFMMAVIGLSLPEIIILRKVLSVKLIAVFVGVVTAGILLVGYLFNLLQIQQLAGG